MKKTKSFISVLLLVVGIFALFLGCMEIVRRIHDTKQAIAPAGESFSADSKVSDETITSATESAFSGDESSAESSTGSSESVTGSSESVTGSSESTTESASSGTEPIVNGTVEVPEAYVSPYNDYFAKYSDIAAWFQIPGTIIDYPVMWTPGDETYYLYRHYDGSDNINGSLLLDTDSSLSPLTTNLIIHGHNMKSGVMFGYLPMYEDQSYYEQHKEMLLYTPDGERTYEVIAVFRSQVYKKNDTCFKYYKFFEAETEEAFNDFYNNIKALSIYDTGVTAEFGDHFITLSTCVSHVENGRFVVVAKETTDIVSSK